MKTKCCSLCCLISGILIVAATQLRAQGTLSVPLRLNVDFSPTPGSPGTNQLSGDANYFLNGWNYDTSSPEENVLDVYFSLGANSATDGWIFQKNGDGSLTPIFEITNELYLADSPFPGASSEGSFPGNQSETYPTYIYSESYQLTADQVQSLLAGNWYAEMNYNAGDTYFGSLTPVPEPESLVLLGLGMAAILIRRRK